MALLIAVRLVVQGARHDIVASRDPGSDPDLGTEH
jgi:hypothetical protein